MVRLAEAGIEAYVAHGNHDPASGWSARLEMPETVHVFPTDHVGRFEVRRNGVLVAAVYGRSFAVAAVRENLAQGYRRQGSEPLAIGVLHANVGGDEDYDNYAPASLGDLRAAGMDYWALGHIHKQEILARDPWVAYAGSPQGLSPKETGDHGCLAVSVSPGGVIEVEPIATAPIGWVQLTVDAAQADSLDGVRGLLAAACEQARAASPQALVARMRVIGRTAAHADLSRPGLLAELAEELRTEAASRSPWLWLDRLDDTTASAIDLAHVRAGSDFAAEAVRVADELEADEAVLAALVGELSAPVATTLGSGYTPSLSPTDLLTQARDAALDLLLASGGEDR
jgi:DNA repair exonuclease SbcCD nuclease subunit